MFDIYALLRLGDAPVEESEIVAAPATGAKKVRQAEVCTRFRETSDASNAWNAIKLPSESRRKYLADWSSINAFVRGKAVAMLRRAGAMGT